MALQHLRSSTADKRPTPAAMSDGQLALNTNLVSPGLFFKDSNGDSVKIGPVHVGTTAPNVTPGAGGQAGNSKGEAWLDTTATNPILKVWNGSAFVAVQPVGTGTVVSTTDTGTVTSTMILDGTILNADINASAAIVDTKLATIATGGKVSNSATTATNANTASAIVARDGSGNFTAGTITAALTGAASSNVLKAGDTMTGALVVPLASAATPSLTFTGDLNTGFYSPGADTLAAVTAGNNRLHITSAGNVGINTTNPSQKLEVSGNTSIIGGGFLLMQNTNRVQWGSSNTAYIAGQDGGSGYLALATAGGERARIDPSGRLLVGTSSAFATRLGASALTPGFQVREGGAGSVLLFNGVNGGSPATIYTVKSRGATYGTIVQNNDNLFRISAAGDDGVQATEAARIDIAVDGTPGANDMPGRLVFSTTADGASSPAERMRITSAGLVGIGTSSPGSRLTVAQSGGFSFELRNTSAAADNQRWAIGQGATNLDIGALTDAGAGGGNLFRFNRSAQQIQSFQGYQSGAAWFHVDNSTGRVGIGTTSPGSALEINAAAATSPFIAKINTSEAARIDPSGRLLVGTSTSTAIAAEFNIQTQANSAAAGIGLIRQGGTTSGNGPNIRFARSRGTSLNDVTVVADGDNLGTLAWHGADGVDFASEAASIQVKVDGTAGANDMPGRLVFSTTADGASTPTERMRITQSGAAAICVDNIASIAALWVASKGTSNTTQYLFYGTHSATGVQTGTGSFLVFNNGNVQNTNNSYAGISDIKLKENIVDAASQWNDIKALRPVNYNLKPETGHSTHTQIGLVAQEVELVSPGLVSESPDRDEDGNDLGTVTKSVSYSVLYMKAVKALQEAMARIENLEAAVTALQQS
jgi:hypothetical protein